MGSVNKIIKKSPNFVKSAFYKYVPFRYRYGKVYGETLDFLLESQNWSCLLYTSPSPRDGIGSSMPSSA